MQTIVCQSTFELTHSRHMHTHTHAHTHTCTHTCTQSVLDSTYYTECQFVEEGFLKDQAKENIFQMISSLSMPVTLCCSTEQVNSLLDVQQLECLHWRVGALLYMYCNTLMGSEERKKEIEVEEFREVRM